MNWIELHTSPLWTSLWESEEIQNKIQALRHQITETSETDPHTLGRLRGQLAAFNELQSLVSAKAEQERRRSVEVANRGARQPAQGWRPFAKVR